MLIKFLKFILLAKHKKSSFPISTSKSSSCCELIHSDFWGPFSVVSYYVFKYFLTIVDDYNIYTWIYLLKTKDVVKHSLKNSSNMVQTQFNTKHKVLRSNNGISFG